MTLHAAISRDGHSQRFPLASAVVDAIDIPPSICGQMGQQDPHVQHPRPLDAPPHPSDAQAGPAVFVHRCSVPWRQPMAADDGNVLFQWQGGNGSFGGDGDGR
jgi:hypothetical protein